MGGEVGVAADEIIQPSDEPYAFWERQVHALLLVLVKKKLMSVDELRRSVEALPNEACEAMTYYEKWAAAITTVCLERNTIARQDLDRYLGLLSEDPPIKFAVGDLVRVKLENSAVRWRKPHLRTPGYIFGVVGVIERECMGHFKNPELAAYRETGPNQPMYRVRFSQQDVWEGYCGDPQDTLDIEIYQGWLEPATAEMLQQQQAARRRPAHHTDVHGAHHAPEVAGEAAHHDSDRHHQSDHHHTGHEHDGYHDGEHHEHHHDGHHGGEHHEHHHEHASGSLDHGDHVHDPRVEVEQKAVDKEGDDTERRRLSEALIATLVERGVVTPDELRREVEVLDAKAGSGAGPRLVARAWTDPAFKQRLLQDAISAAAELGISTSNYAAAPTDACPTTPADDAGSAAAKRQLVGTVLVALEATEKVHHLIVCTLCSCYPFAVLGLSPPWYRSRSYRSRAVRDPRGVLKDFGTVLPEGTTVRVHDSTADCRYIVIPLRPAGTEGWSEEQLQQLVTRDSMIGVSLAKQPHELQPKPLNPQGPAME